METKIPTNPKLPADTAPVLTPEELEDEQKWDEAFAAMTVEDFALLNELVDELVA